MAVQKIEYPNKVRGDLFTTANATEVKQVVNHNADELATMQNTVQTVNQSLTNLSQSVTGLREETKIPVISMAANDGVIEIAPGKKYKWSSPLSALHIAFISGTDGISNEYMLQFKVGSDNFQLAFESSVKWLEEPDWQNGWIYQVSIEDGLAISAGWEDATT